jgi:hypothetical protein
MIGYFLKEGGPEIGDTFVKYNNEYNYSFLEKSIKKKKYGNDLKLILIEYHVSGKFLDWVDIHPRVLNYSNKNKDIGVVIGVKAEDFLALSDQGKKQFMVGTTRQAVLDVRKRLEKKKLDINFDQLLKDLNEVNKKYLGK